jgi:putative acyl-CoA dehydrogenase
LVLRGSEGKRISDVGSGVKYIANMLNITRIHNGISSISYMRRIIAAANDYKERRVAFGKAIGDHDLHLHVIAILEKTYRGHLLLLLETISIL